MPPAVPSVYEHLDYRAFLRAYYAHKKEHSRGFSYRAFSRKAGLRSPNYFKLVADGDRNLSAEMAVRFARALDLDAEATTYFVDLVAFNQASTSDERNVRLTRLQGSRRYRKAHKLELAQAAYHSTWYLPAIRELAASAEFRDDAGWIAQTMRPRITRAEAARALETLEELGLLVRAEDGSLAQGQAVVTTGPEMRALHIANYHRMMMARAAESIDAVPSQERDISALTLCLGSGTLQRLKTRIQEFRRELLDIEAEEDNPRVVVQVNLQLFPLTQDPDTESSS